MWTLTFWKAAGARAVRAFASTVLSVGLVGGGMMNAFDANWQHLLGVGLGGSVVSLLLSLAGNAYSGTGPSFTQNETIKKP